MTSTEASTEALVAAEAHTARNYHPLPVVVATADGAWMTDVRGRRYLDLLAGYSALNFGHGNPRLIAAAKAQLERVTLTSRAFHHDRFGAFCEQLARAAELGEHLLGELRELTGTGRVTAVRGRGLWAGVDIAPAVGTGREISERLMDRGVLVKDTHGSTIRIAPPLMISREDLDWGLAQLRVVLGV
ncbi:aminotransferase class III-fold pyridoxal phosphate-dependent enzyme [Streptomyces sp. NBC_01515]|uniref:aminotransferase class III-fold pyridoxal phosphate-dependent enzyme n=1 Tax=Streptomyces sp. NBC_01515 TaxID=2903890 RepID=UPI00386D7D1B